MNAKNLGRLGEKIAIQYLQNKGYQILAKNYSFKFISGPQRGEIDIIAKHRQNIFNILQKKKNNTIHFIEVKTLTNRLLNPVFSPEDKVNRKKQRKIIRTAQEWLTEKKIPLESKWQIDIITIRINPENKAVQIRYFKNTVSDL